MQKIPYSVAIARSFDGVCHVFQQREINSGGLLETRCRVFVAKRTLALQ